MNFRIRVVKNIGDWSEKCFGTPGTEFKVKNGSFRDRNCFKWDNDLVPFNDFNDVEEINQYFGANDYWQTIFEEVNEE